MLPIVRGSRVSYTKDHHICGSLLGSPTAGIWRIIGVLAVIGIYLNTCIHIFMVLW